MYRVKAGNVIINEPDTKSENVILGSISKAVNNVDSFTFRMYPNNSGYNALEPMITHIDVEDTNSGNIDVFHGRVLTINNKMDSAGMIYREVVCEGELSYLCDTITYYDDLSTAINPQIPPIRIIQDCIADHNDQVSEDKQIFKGEMIGRTPQYSMLTWGYSTNLETIQALLNDESIGGEIRLRYQDGKRYLDYTETTFTKGSPMKIELAVNMQSATQAVDPSSIVTRLYPLGARIGSTNERLTIDGLYIEDTALAAKYGVISRTVIFDEANNKSRLKIMGLGWLKKQVPIKKQYTITAANLSLIDKSYEDFEVGTQYHIINPLISLDEVVRCIGIVINIEDPSQTKLVFGDKFETATSQAIQRETKLNKKIIDAEKNASPLIKEIVENQTQLLTGADGGYIYYRTDQTGKPSEIFLLDNEDINTAASAIRFNKNGIGFWKQSDGGSAMAGPYTSAWTIDGVFNTAFIVAQVLTGLRINNGSGTFTVDQSGNVTARSINILGGRINIQTDSETTDIIRLKHNEWTLEISPLQIKVTNDTIGGVIRIQAGGIFGTWNSEQKFVLNSNTGDIYTAGGGYVSFRINTNDREVTLNYPDSTQTAIQMSGDNAGISLYNSDGQGMVYIRGGEYGYAHFADRNGNITVAIDGQAGTIRAPGGVIST
ncbi:MAG: phage tail protein [Ruminococcus sp.]|nr:phage tail protein [Ruminococcus sp.]